MKNLFASWAARLFVLILLSALAYTGGVLIEQATATDRASYCEGDVCIRFFGLGLCSGGGANTGCDRTGGSCRTYLCEFN